MVRVCVVFAASGVLCQPAVCALGPNSSSYFIVASHRVGCAAQKPCVDMCVHVLFSALPYAACYYHLAFDSARASSTYSSGSDPFAFVADEAASPGARYWCSSDAHSLGEVVTWTGSLDARRGAVGINLHWAYSPG